REPGAGVGRHAVGGPARDGGRERLGRRLLGDVEVAEPPGQGGNHARPLLVVGAGDRLTDFDHRNGRTSTFRLQAFDPSAASRSGGSRSPAAGAQRRGGCSSPGGRGPAVTPAAPFRLWMTVAVSGPPRPPAKTQWPSARSPSLNTSMAAISSGGASSVESAI